MPPKRIFKSAEEKDEFEAVKRARNAEAQRRRRASLKANEKQQERSSSCNGQINTQFTTAIQSNPPNNPNLTVTQSISNIEINHAVPQTLKSINSVQQATPGFSRQTQSIPVNAQNTEVTIQSVLKQKYDSHCQISEMCDAVKNMSQLFEFQLPDMKNTNEWIDQNAITFGLLNLISESSLNIGLVSTLYWSDHCRQAESNPVKYFIVKPQLKSNENFYLLIPILDHGHFVLSIMKKDSKSLNPTIYYCDSMYNPITEHLKSQLNYIYFQAFIPFIGLNSNVSYIWNDISKQGDKQTDSCNCGAFVVSNAQNFFENVHQHDRQVFLTKLKESGQMKRQNLFNLLQSFFSMIQRDDETMDINNRDVEMDEIVIDENYEKRNKRLKQMQSYIVNQRARETKQEKNDRLAADKIQHQNIRIIENEQHKLDRLAADKIQHQNVRIIENEQQKTNRLAEQLIRQRNARIVETEQEKTDRLAEQLVRQQNIRKNSKKSQLKLNLAANSTEVITHRLSKMNIECISCGALHFKEETVQSKETFNDCCNHGRIYLPPQPKMPQELEDLFTEKHRLSNEFFKNIRKYNAVNSFAAFNTNMQTFKTIGPYCFTIQGQIYYEVDENVSENPNQKYGQLFFSDPSEAVEKRLKAITGTKKELMDLLDKILREVNPFAKLYIKMGDLIKEQEQKGEPVEDVSMSFKMRPGYDPKRFNEPSVDEIGAVFSTDASGQIPEMSLVIQHLGEPSPRVISSLCPLATAWTYPLIYPKGTLGWSIEMTKQNANKHTKISRAQFHSYRMAVRKYEFNALHYAKKLFQQHCVDAWVQIEADDMQWIRNNQKKLKTGHYHELIASLNRQGEQTGQEIGRIVVLPSTHFGSPRFMRENYQDAMTIVLKNGKPDLFVTMTCNPLWPDITETIKEITVPGVKQTASDRPDIVSRVFSLKVEALLDELTKKQVFGEVKCWVYVTEFQKRGLPHVHLLMSLKETRKFSNAEIIDQFFSAQLPNKNEDPELLEMVSKFMIHRVCGDQNPRAPCMINDKCRHKFPKAFLQETTVNENGYPSLKRPNDGRIIEIKKINYDNRRVVPYSPYLLKKFNCHINVEIVSSIKNVKYLYKYAYKGHDAASLEFKSSGNINHDEIKDHIDARYVGPSESTYRVLKRPMHGQSHHVERLPIHLENNQSYYIDEKCTDEQIAAAMNKNTKLMDYFLLNQRDPDARNIQYPDLPTFYTWRKTDTIDAQGNSTSAYQWGKRKAYYNTTGRIYAISPSQGDLWYLRLLLQHVKGAESFKDLRTVNGIEYQSNNEACLALGLIEDDHEYIKCMKEAIEVAVPRKLRTLFANILLYCNPAAPHTLWELFMDDLSEDINRHINNKRKAIEKAYRRINTLLRRENKSIKDFPSMLQIEDFDEDELEINYDHVLQVGLEMYGTLNEEQKLVVDKVLNSLDNNGDQKCFFVDGLGGTGKTYVYKALCHLINGRKKKFLSCAFTGIAALLLPNGRTCHKTFGLGVPLDRDSNSTLSKTNQSGKMLMEADVIIWDEAPMAPRYALEIAERKMQELMDVPKPFGNKIIILGGDFRQILPILKFGTISETINLSIRSSILWKLFEKLHLHKNMRAKQNEIEFAEFLKTVGEGALNDKNEKIMLPEKCIVEKNLEFEIFGQLIQTRNFEDMGNSAILVSKHIGVNESNKKILSMLEGESKTYLSIDTATDADKCPDQALYLPEYLNTIDEGSLPPHKLELKRNAIVILIRNLSQEDGLCNGTRMLIINMNVHSIECQILTGEHAGETHFIPRINNTIEYKGMFQLNRKQFPLKLAFAMTINKSQGQTFERVGLNLEHAVFEHGQLYVALSRARSWDSLKILIPTDSTNKTDNKLVKNIVHREVFTNLWK